LSGHDHFVTRLEYSPDGGILLTRSEDTTVRLWNANTGQVIRVLTDVGGMFNGRFTPDGSKVLTEAGGPAFAKPWRGRLWPVFVDVPAMIDTAKAEATRCLARSQRLAAFLDAEPPAWCIEGKKWPYDTQAWRDWLGFRRENLHPPLPDSADWKSWLAAH
jgi:hypothetical protein